MGFRFRKSFKLMPGVRLNLNKKSFGLSVGGKGLRKTVNSNGRRTTSVGVPGTGLYYTKSSGGGARSSSSRKSKTKSGGGNSAGRYCGQCGAANPVDVKFCESCGAPIGKNVCKNITVILWLVFFFPVGLYLMWRKTNWARVIKISVSAFFAVIYSAAMISSVVSLINGDAFVKSQSGIRDISVSNVDVAVDLERPFFPAKVNAHIYTSYDAAELTVDDFHIKVADETIAHVDEIEYLDLTDVLTFSVVGDTAGETTITVESADGVIQSDPIHVTVIGEKPTEEQTEAPEQPPVTEQHTAAQQPDEPIVPAAPQQITYIVNTSTGVFHRASCGHAKRIDAANRGEVSAANSKEMEAKGYKPCGTCIK